MKDATAITEAQWAQASTLLGISTDEVRTRYARALQNPGGLVPAPAVVEEVLESESNAALLTKSKCIKKKFTIGINSVIDLKVSLEFCPGTNWKIEAKVTLYVLGEKVKSETFKLDSKHIKRCIEYSIVLVEGKICLEFKNLSCLYISGKVEYWVPFSWHEKKFNEKIVCF